MKTIFISLCFLFMFGFYQSGSANPKGFFMTISPEKASEIIQQNKGNQDFEVLDVRTPNEYKAGHLQNVSLIDFYSPNFKASINKLDKNKTYLVYCRSGVRSGRSLLLMKDLGFNKVYDLEGGIINWNQAGLPVNH